MDVRAPRVAVIDDDDEFASLMEALLEEEGYSFVRPSMDATDPARNAGPLLRAASGLAVPRAARTLSAPA